VSGYTFRGLRHPAAGDPIVDVDELEVAEDDRIVVFGPNGAGKSTLLRLLAGTVGAGARAPIAYLPQTPYFFRGRAGWNLGLGLDTESAARARQLATRLGVEPLLDAEARRLSGGERQRLALARVLARPERLVLLDEPLGPLDLRDRMRAATVINEALAGRASLVVTHDRSEAAVLGDRMLVMLGGHIVQDGSVAAVFSHPGDQEVAAVVGVRNVIGGFVAATGDTTTVVDLGGVTIAGLGRVDEGRPATVLFGGEAVTIYPPGVDTTSSARNTWTGTVVEISPAGTLIEVVVDVGVPIAALVTPGALDALDLTEGAIATVAVKATAVEVLPR
jgi:molybdopterin-binding protein